MNSLNSILLEGNVCSIEKMISTSHGTKIFTFKISSNRMFKLDDEINREVSFFEITTYGKLAEICNEYLDNGRGVRVFGRLKQSRWNDDQGKWHSKVHIVANHVEFKPEAV